MPCFIIKLTHQDQDYYLEWSTIVDAPVTYGMSLAEFRDYYQVEYGISATVELEARLVRVEQKGTSSQVHRSVDEVLEGNRAGEHETCLTKQEIVRRYCLDRPDDNRVLSHYIGEKVSTTSNGGMAYARCPGDLREALAAIQHEIWSHWMQHQWSKGTTHPDGSFTLPRESVERWARQQDTHYDGLSDKERDSDREQADKILRLLHRPELLPELQKLVLEILKANAPFDLQQELQRLRSESAVTLVINETRTHWRVESLQDNTFTARYWDYGSSASAERFDRAHVSEHDLQFLTLGAEFWCVSALEDSKTGPRSLTQRLIFVPSKKI